MEVKLLNKKENIFDDNIAFLEQWDFSKANMSEENRINAITQVASICYQSSKSLDSESLYNRLMAESMGLPSSSFEFVPMLFDYEQLKDDVYALTDVTIEDTKMLKYGEKIEDGKYLLTNFRAVIYDFENLGIDLRDHFNTEKECEIIKAHFKVFLYKVDFPTRSQMVRHRVNWQELSRRYVSGKRVPFDFYISEKMKNVISKTKFTISSNNENIDLEVNTTTSNLLRMCLEHYYKAIEDGVKPQEARRIIPQAGYSQIWGAFQPTQYSNFMKLRDDSHAQWEIAQVAKAMRELINER
jgi:thymidylate synthase (FAD)